MLKTRRLVRKVYNEYRLKCKPRLRPSTEFKCEEADTENMTLEEFKNYELKCGKVSDNCDNVNVNELSEQEVRFLFQFLMKPRTLILKFYSTFNINVDAELTILIRVARILF